MSFIDFVMMNISLSLTAPLHKSLIFPEGIRTTTDILFLVLQTEIQKVNHIQ